MSELTEVVQFVLKFLLVGVYMTCYVIGGRGGTPKWIRRFLGSALFGGGIIAFSLWQQVYLPWLLLYPVLLSIALCFGYGGDSLWEKVRRRAIWGTVIGISSLPVAIVTGSWVLFGCQFGLSLLSSVIFGVINPFKGAVAEEGLIGICSVLLVPFYF